MDVFEMADVISRQKEGGRPFLEFFRAPDLSLGIYTLPAGSTDPQVPHNEDEIYLVAAGTGSINIDGEDTTLTTGSIVYVAKHVEHHFHSITEDLSLLVVFAPAFTA